MKNRLKIPRNKDFEKLYHEFVAEIKHLRKVLIQDTEKELLSLSDPDTAHEHKLYYNIKYKISLLEDIEKEHKQIEKEIGDTDHLIKSFKKRIEQIYEEISDAESKLEDRTIKSQDLKKLKIRCDLMVLFDSFLKENKSSVSFATLANQLKDTKNLHDKELKELIRGTVSSKNYIKLNSIL